MKTAVAFATAASLAWLPSSTAAEALDDLLEVRQVVIRAPELEVAELMAAGIPKSDEEIHLALREAMQAGRARLIADITSAADQSEVKASQGRHVWLVTERDQDVDRLYLQPTGFDEYFVGTSLEARLQLSAAKEGITGVSTSWKAGCSPCGPAMTRWPTSWLRISTRDHKPDPQGRLIRGWLDNYDVFTETLVGEHWFEDTQMHLLGVAPPADQAWPGKARPGRWLDVFLAQVRPRAGGLPFTTGARRKAVPAPKRAVPVDPFAVNDNAPASSPAPKAFPADPFANPQPREVYADAQVMFYGIGLNATEAALLIAERGPAGDEALLQQLLERVKKGSARLHVCVGMTGKQGCPGIVTAAREHQYPTEMPSIPSAWANRPVGTVLEVEDRIWSLQHDLAPPRRTEWRLALDDPKAVMWEPQFRSLRASSSFPRKQGAQLVGLQRIPDLMKGDGIAENETVLLFARRKDDMPEENIDDQPQPVEAEVLVLEVPGAEPADFEKPPEDIFAHDDTVLFENLLKRLKAGQASVAAHVLVSTLSGRRSMVRTAEEIMYATEFDPPEEKGQPRMRPTALEVSYAGDLLEIDATTHPTQSKIAVQMSFTHSTGIPVEAPLETALAFAAKDESMKDYPAPEHPSESWTPAELSLESGSVVFLGARKPPGIQRQVVHVAYLRVRKVP